MSGNILKIAYFPRLASKHGLKTTSLNNSHGVRYNDWLNPEICGDREVVGFGQRGDPAYDDRMDTWYPSVRFRANDATVTPIREKELSDWKKLTLDEKKLLYRYSFCQTLAEYEAPNGYWKVDWAMSLIVISFAVLYACFLQKFFYPPLDPTLENEYKEGIIERRLVLEKGRFMGPASYYDYENNRWKD